MLYWPPVGMTIGAGLGPENAMTGMIRKLSNERFQPKPGYVPVDPTARAHYSVNQRIMASLVGLIAFAMPLAMILAARRGDICFRDSISHFYYAPFLGIVLVASLASIATFLFAYRGQNPWENILATLAGLGALGVALFPTTGHGCAGQGDFLARTVVTLPAQDAPGSTIALAQADAVFALFPQVGLVHYASAAVLFAFLAWYCFAVFPRVVPEVQTKAGGAKLSLVKATRNVIYFASGTVIVLAAAAMGLRGLAVSVFGLDLPWWNAANLTLWCEAAALWAFGVSWTVKGRLFGLILKDRGE